VAVIHQMSPRKKLSTILTNLTESPGKKTWQLKPRSSGYPWGKVGSKVGDTYPRPKDSNAAVGVHDRATGKALEGADRQTDRQTDFPPIIVKRHYTSKPFTLHLHNSNKQQLILTKFCANNAPFIGNQMAKFRLNLPTATVVFVKSPQNTSVSGLCG